MASNTTTTIPSFHLTESLEPGTQEWKLMSQSIRSAFEAYGCILVNYDGISGDEREGLFAAMRSLFDLPVDAKRRNTDKQSLTTYPGAIPAVPLYEAQGVMNAVDIDKAEAFTRLMWPQGNHKFWHLISSKDQEENLVVGEKNLSLNSSVLECNIQHPFHDGISQTINSMSKKMRGILHIILDMVIDSYGVSRDEPHIGGTDALLHMIKYTAPEKEEPALGLSEHTDINYLTILCQNEVDGLSLKTKEGEWFPVNPGRQFVVFAGQSLRAWSNGKLHSPLHQVIFRGLKDRLTCAVFLKPKRDQIVEPAPEFIADEHPPRYKAFAYGEFHDYTKKVFADCDDILQKYAGL